MIAEFVGSTDVQHVAPYPESRLGMPGLLTSLADVDPIDAYEALLSYGHVNAEAETYPLPATDLKVGSSLFTFTPIHSPYAERVNAADAEAGVTAADVTAAIDKQLEEGTPVGLLYKGNGSHKWILLTGYYEQEGEKGPYHVIDPSEEKPGKRSRLVVSEMIQRSLDHIDAYACAIEVRAASQAS